MMKNLTWLDKWPERDEIMWDMLCRKAVFSTWLVMDHNYKLPQMGMKEFVYIDGDVKENDGGYRCSWRQEKMKYALYTTAEGDLTPLELQTLTPEMISELRGISPEEWNRLANSHDWAPVGAEEPLSSPAFFHRRDGHVVLKHPKWHQYITPENKNFRQNVASFCMAESITPFELLKLLNPE